MSAMVCVSLDVFINASLQLEMTFENILSDVLREKKEFQVLKEESIGLKNNNQGKLIVNTYKRTSSMDALWITG